MQDIIGNLGVVSGLVAGGAAIAQGLVALLTLVLPLRPSWAAIVVALLGGLLGVVLLAMAQGLFHQVSIPTDQLVAQLILGGLAAGFAAVGLNGMNATGDTKRYAAQAAQFGGVGGEVEAKE